nr:hypothetical protein JVH1_6792 [Rhodococcus sp. JVH1]
MIEFHSILINSTRNRFLALVVELMGRTLDRLNLPDLQPENRWRMLEEHKRMLEALRRHDAEEVRSLTVAHLCGVWEQQISPSSFERPKQWVSAKLNWMTVSLVSHEEFVVGAMSCASCHVWGANSLSMPHRRCRRRSGYNEAIVETIECNG